MIFLSEFAMFSSELLVLGHWINLKSSLEVKKERKSKSIQLHTVSEQSLPLKTLPAALTISVSQTMEIMTSGELLFFLFYVVVFLPGRVFFFFS